MDTKPKTTRGPIPKFDPVKHDPTSPCWECSGARMAPDDWGSWVDKDEAEEAVRVRDERIEELTAEVGRLQAHISLMVSNCAAPVYRMYEHRKVNVLEATLGLACFEYHSGRGDWYDTCCALMSNNIDLGEFNRRCAELGLPVPESAVGAATKPR